MGVLEYLDFVIHVEQGDGHSYKVTLFKSPVGDTSGIMTLPVSSDDWQSRLSIVAEARGAPDPLGLESTNSLGKDLFQALIGPISGHYLASRLQADKEGKGLRLQLRIQDRDLATLPWEYLTDSDHNPLVLSLKTPVVRHLEVTGNTGPLTVQPPIRILGMVGYHENLNVETEKALIGRAIERLIDSGVMALDWVDGHTWRDLQDAFEDRQYHVFHFIGHGMFDTKSQTGKLLLESEPGQDDPIYRLDSDYLGRWLADHDVRLAVLNSCKGARASEGSLHSSTGAILGSKGVPAVVSMQYEISDAAALEFSRTFYRSVSKGLPLEIAVSEARNSIGMATQGTVEWGTPVLHMRAENGLLFEIDKRGAIDLSIAVRGAQPAAQPQAVPLQPAQPSGGARSMLSALAGKVKRYWLDSVLQKKLEQSVHLSQGLGLLAGAVNSDYPALGAMESISASEDLGDQKPGDVLDEYGNLLVLGDPGTGKTVVLLELARDLLRKNAADPMRPVPVVFNLSSWAAKKGRLADWMTEELTAKYQIPKKIGGAWLSEGSLFPLLDGLDEVKEESRAECLEAINNWLAEALSGVVVCSRFKEYNKLPSRLKLNAAIMLQLFAPRQVLTFVQDAGPPLAALRTLLERDSGLLDDACTPLMLTLMVRAFQGADATEFIADQNLAARRRAVMDAFVKREFQRAREGGTLV